MAALYGSTITLVRVHLHFRTSRGGDEDRESSSAHSRYFHCTVEAPVDCELARIVRPSRNQPADRFAEPIRSCGGIPIISYDKFTVMLRLCYENVKLMQAHQSDVSGEKNKIKKIEAKKLIYYR